MSKNDPLDLMIEEIARIHKIMGPDKGGYRHGRKLMLDAADQLDYNVGWALRTMHKARRSFEDESQLIRRYTSFKKRWALMDSFHFGEEERGLERELDRLLGKGDFDDCEPVLADLERLLDQDVSDHIDIGLLMEVADPNVQLGKGTTLTITMHNHSAFPIHVDALIGRSEQAAINVLDFYKGEMPPTNDRGFQLNVIPKVEGDIAVEVEATIENDGRTMIVRKCFSLKVSSPPQVMQTVQTIAPNEVRYARPAFAIQPRTSSFDPLELVSSGTVDQWADCIEVFARVRTPIDLSDMVKKDPEHIKTDGYANLFRSLLAMPYDRSIDWEVWFNQAGFTGEDYTKRCAKLLFRMSFDRSVELEMDGSVGSSNIENLIGAMQIASGDIKREERSRKSWKVEGEIDGNAFSLNVEKSVRKDEAGKAKAAMFRIISG